VVPRVQDFYWWSIKPAPFLATSGSALVYSTVLNENCRVVTTNRQYGEANQKKDFVFRRVKPTRFCAEREVMLLFFSFFFQKSPLSPETSLVNQHLRVEIFNSSSSGFLKKQAFRDYKITDEMRLVVFCDSSHSCMFFVH